MVEEVIENPLLKYKKINHLQLTLQYAYQRFSAGWVIVGCEACYVAVGYKAIDKWLLGGTDIFA